MTPDKDKALCEQFPDIFQTIHGTECGDGWYQLLSDLCAALADCHVVADQVKEKFGGLRFYFHVNGPCDSETFDAIYGAVEAAEQRSFSICDVCGAPGKLRIPRGWHMTRCDKCSSGV